jgi:sigma-B regulation protein RsbU (phosphoserine phosphatase)
MALCYELAGHNPPTLLRGERAIALEGTGPVLGLLPGAQYDDHVLTLEQGDRLLLTTDGVTEAFSPEGEEFGEERLTLAARHGGMSAHAIRTAVMKAVSAFAQDNFHDDASIMVVHVRSNDR